MAVTKPTVAIVSGSKPVALALERLLQLSILCPHVVVMHEFHGAIPPGCSVIFDVSSTFHSSYDPAITITASFAFEEFRKGLLKLACKPTVQIFRGGADNAFLLVAGLQSGPVRQSDPNTRKIPMIISNLESIWHHLKHDRNEALLDTLRALGHGREADFYAKNWEIDEKAAKLFAQRMEYAAGDGGQAFGTMPNQADHPVATATARKAFYALLVDDQEQMYDRLAEEVRKVNQDNPDYELRLRHVSNAQRAESALDGRGLQAVILDYFLTESDFSDPTQSGTSSVNLSKLIAERRPGLAVFGLTGFVPHRAKVGQTEGWRATDPEWRVERVFFKHDPAEIHELLRTIIQSVRKRASTPFFSSLKHYSEWPTTVFHALPLSRSKSVASSQWAREFANFYGEHYFAGETSSTMDPLDTIFGPKRSLRLALDLAARAFHAQETMFVTNGTTGANTIVYRALVQPGDLVLLDRNCHKSHHYAALQSGASVVYVEPEHVDDYGISSIALMETIENAVRKHKQAHLLALTHPTFDGVCYDPYQVMKRVHAINPEIVFLFDEAWFAYAAFHPEFRDRSAMVAAERLWAEVPRVPVRVYVTQSTHKTLSALRQGSMIHIRDPWLTDETHKELIELALEEAQIAFTTTSPNIHILGSLDVARMQADLEGHDCLTRALEIASWIRDSLIEGSNVRALNVDDLLTPALKEEKLARLDPLKLTLHFSSASGMRFREEELYRKHGIQVNKYSHNTVLALVTIGTTFSMADHLVRSLKQWQPQSPDRQLHNPEKIPRFSGFAKSFCSSEGAGDLSKAYYAALKPGNTKRIPLGNGSDGCEALGHASARFVSPYPPGYPILVPGQIIDLACINYLRSLRKAGVNDIHGLEKDELCILLAS